MRTINHLNLTQEEIDRYAPYHTIPAFERGMLDHRGGFRAGRSIYDVNSVDGQAYDRGLECASRRWLADYRKRFQGE